MGLNGRELELSLPLCLIADEISRDLLKETTLTLKSIFLQKKEEELTENIDISLYDFVSQYTETSWISMTQIIKDFRSFLDTNDEEINTKWLGRALKRLVLIKDKKRLGRGRYFILDIEKAQKKIKMFKVEPTTPEKIGEKYQSIRHLTRVIKDTEQKIDSSPIKIPKNNNTDGTR